MPLATSCVVALFVISAVCVGMGIFMLTGLHTIIIHGVEKRIPLVNPTAHMWRAFTNPAKYTGILYRKYWWFNITNPVEASMGARINLQPVGPYYYREADVKPSERIRWFPNDTVAYKYDVFLDFDEARSVDERTGKQLYGNETIVQINYPIYGSAYRAGRFPDEGLYPLIRDGTCLTLTKLINESVGPTGVFHTAEARQFLWGVNSTVWQTLAPKAKLADVIVPTIYRAQWNGSAYVPSKATRRHGELCPMSDDLSLCNSSSNSFSMEDVGRHDHSKATRLIQWAGNKELWWFREGAECRKIRGRYSPHLGFGLTEESHPWVFIDTLFRSIKLDFDKWIDDFKGIRVMRFRFSPDNIANNAHNQYCFDTHTRGFWNDSLPGDGNQWTSKAYFIDADISKINVTVDGRTFHSIREENSDKEKHDSFVYVEPVTGTIVRSLGRMQSGTDVGPVYVNGCSGLRALGAYPINRTKHMKETMLPLFWGERSTEATQESIDYIRDHVLRPLAIVRVFGWIILAFGVLILPVAILQGVSRYRQNRDDAQCTDKESLHWKFVDYSQEGRRSHDPRTASSSSIADSPRAINKA